MKNFVYTSLIMAFATLAVAQKPFVNSIDKMSATPNELVTITGTGFSTPTVYFGTGEALTIVNSSANVIEVLVPATATYGRVSVRNANGLIGTSSQMFTPAFDNDAKANANGNPINQTPTVMNVGQAFPYDICLCDFDGDDLLDAAISNSNANNIITIAKNNNGGNPGSFVLENFDVNPTDDDTPFNIECGDLDGDGKPDLAYTFDGTGEPFVDVLENTSPGAGTVSFAVRQRLVLPAQEGGGQRRTNRVRMADMDGDGKPDLIVGSSSANDPILFIFRNNTASPAGNVSFETTPIQVSVPGAVNTGSPFPADFDNDGKLDLVVVPFGVTGSIHVLRNTSLSGSISFASEGTVGGTAQRRNVVAGDFNQDGLTDFAVTRFVGSDGGSLEVLENDGNFNFTSLALISSGSINHFGIDAGDMNGDGLPDLVVGSVGNDGEVVYYENQSTVGGTTAFDNTPLLSTYAHARNVKIGDLNDDGIPDLAFVQAPTSGSPTNFTYIINDLCMTPVITPDDNPLLTFCQGQTFSVSATKGQNITYTWEYALAITSPGTFNTLTETGNELDFGAEAGFTEDIILRVTADNGTCSVSSVQVDYNHNAGTAGPAPTITLSNEESPGVVCAESALQLTSSVSCANGCRWYGPNGWEENSATDMVEVAASAAAVHSGTYYVVAFDGTCESAVGSVEVFVAGAPSTNIQFSACDGGNITLSVTDFDALLGGGYDFSYAWLRDGATPVGTDSPTLVTSAVGDYTVTITDNNNCSSTTATFELNAALYTSITASNSALDDLTDICVDVPTTFTASDATGISYTWEIEDPAGAVTETLTGNNIDYTFSTTGSKVVRLITRYANGVGCSETNITVSAEPAYTADVSAPGINKCPSEEVTLSFSETDILEYTWDDADNTVGALTVSAAGTYTATYITATGCEIVAPGITITNFPGLNLTADSPAIVDGELTLDPGQASVTLSIDNTVTNITWAVLNGSLSGTGVDGITTNQVVVSPATPSVTLQVTGTTSDGCTETEQVIISGGGIRPMKAFSPNSDGQNDCWSVINASSVLGGGDCTLFIMDSRGSIVYKTNDFSDDCLWDGTYQGGDVPEGVYYFVLKCASGGDSRTGSILLAR